MAVHPTSALTVELPEVLSDGLPQTLWRYRWIVATAFCAAIIVAAYIVARSIPMYVSSSRLLYEQDARSAKLTPAAVNEHYLLAQADILASAPVLNDAALALGKQQLKTFGGSTDVYGILKQNLEIQPGKSDATITVSFASPYPSESAVVVNTVVDTYVRFESEHFKNTSHETLLSLQHQKDVVAADLAADRRELRDFQAENASVSFDDTLGMELEKKKLAKLGDELTERQAGVVALNAKYDSLVAQYGPPSTAAVPAMSANQPVSLEQTPPAVTPPPAPAKADDSESDPAWIQNELDLASANLDALQARGLPADNPSVQDALASVARLSKKLAASHRNSGLAQIALARNELDIARRGEAEIQSRFDAQNKSIIDRESKRAELARLKDSVRRSEAAQDQLDSQIKVVDVNDAKPIEINVLDQARPATTPRSNRLSVMSIAAALGLLAGLGLALGLSAMDQRLRSPADIRTLLRLPILGVMPHHPGKPTLATCGLIAHSDPMSHAAEAVRTVRAAIFFAGRSTPARTILVASASRGDGRTSFASNLAIAMAQAGSRTLLLDANFRHPAIPTIFEILRPVGLSDVLSGRVLLDRAINRTPVERLEVLTCGAIPRSPADLLNSGGFTRLMEQLSARYQCIVFDSPPVSTDADARILAAAADLTVYVVRGGETRRGPAEQALEQLLSVGARVLGLIINDATLRTPVQRSRGILRFVESPHSEQQASAGIMGERSHGTISSAAAPLLPNLRMESNMVPEIDVVD